MDIAKNLNQSAVDGNSALPLLLDPPVKCIERRRSMRERERETGRVLNCKAASLQWHDSNGNEDNTAEVPTRITTEMINIDAGIVSVVSTVSI